MKVTIKALSPLHLGSGKADVVLDAEVVHDKYGMPYFPAKRLKGLLYESAIEMAEISRESWFTIDEVNQLFGHNEQAKTGIIIDNFYLKDYDKMYKDWQYLQEKYKSLFTREAVLNAYSSVRYQTSIDKTTGTTVDGSLHNMRVVNKDTEFVGTIKFDEAIPQAKKIIEYALDNLRFAGAKRNRGCGQISCIYEADNGQNANATNKYQRKQANNPKYKVKRKKKRR